MAKHIRYMRISVVILWGTSILLVAGTALLFPTMQTIDSRHAIISAQLQKLEQSGAIAKSVDVISVQKRARTIKEKLASPLPQSPMIYVDRIRAYEQEGIRLTGYQINNTDKPIVQIQGIAPTRQVLQRFVSNLQADALVATVDSPVANFVKSNQSTFVITVTFKTL